MRNTLFFLITVFAVQAVNADDQAHFGAVNAIKIGPASEECLSMIQPDMDLQSKKVRDCFVDVSERAISLLNGITTCAKKEPSEFTSEVCSTIARQLQEIQQPYNAMIEIAGKESNLDEEEIKGSLLYGDTINSEISRWYRGDAAPSLPANPESY